MSADVRFAVWHAPGFLGVRVFSRYFKLRDLRRHRLMFSERNGFNYQRVVRLRGWEFGVRRDPAASGSAGNTDRKDGTK